MAVANSAFRLLVDQVRELQPPAGDLHLILRGQAVQTLDLAAMESPECSRLAGLLAQSARVLRRKLASQGAHDEWEAELIQALGVLEMWMEGLPD